MVLVVAATEMEMGPVRERLAGWPHLDFLVCGIGPVEAATRLAVYLAAQAGRHALVLHCGVAGAYADAGARLLDVCLAEREVLGDLGIEGNGRVIPFPRTLAVPVEFPLDGSLCRRAAALLADRQIGCQAGTFVTVNTASATAARGAALRDRFGALCENMEGAAVARVCQEFALPCLEVRAISNYVEDRDPSRWRLAEACQKNADTVAVLAPALARNAA